MISDCRENLPRIPSVIRWEHVRTAGSRLSSGLWILLPAALLLSETLAQDVLTVPDFQSEILPLLKDRCFECHGPATREGGLRLTSRRDMLARNDSGVPAVIPGQSHNSELMRRVTSGSDGQMPPDGTRLSGEEKERLRNWIDSGASWPDEILIESRHWAYTAPVRPVRNLLRTDTSRPERNEESQLADETDQVEVHPIDEFVYQVLSDHTSGLSRSPPETPAKLLRRVFLDLTGLPPSPDQVIAFESDPSASSYERVVDELLQSPHYGEKWARSWLDLARYADSNGYQADQLRTVWPWRDWVVRAFNSDMPFNQFTVEQLAGDLLPEATTDQRIATGFHRQTTCNVEAGVDPEENRVNQVADRVTTTATVWLGTTLECARCHNHKYDPFTQEDFYRLFAFFNNTPLEVTAPKDGGVQFEVAGPVLELPASPENQLRHRELSAVTADLQQQIRRLKNAASTDETQPLLAELREQLRTAELEMTSVAPVVTAVMTELTERRETRLLKRGDFLTPGDRVYPGTPAILPALDSDPAIEPHQSSFQPSGRLELAKWLVSTENPLTARVTVNRWWAEFFGRGIVDTPEDFGTQGSRPSHPELLDWLAVEFMENGWSMKHVHRLIVTSKTYQQSSRITNQHLERDPGNVLLSRGPRFRLAAEIIRDNALAVSGMLSRRVGGPPVYPPQPDNIWRHVGRNAPEYTTSTNEDRFRRGLYVIWRRSAPYPSFVNFDAPDRTSCIVGRSRSNTPLQALTLMNDPMYVEAAVALAARILNDRPDSGAEFTGVTDHAATWNLMQSRMEYGVRLCIARKPTVEELDILTELWTGEYERYSSFPDLADSLNRVAVNRKSTSWPLATSPADRAAWISLASTLLNLDEFITRN